MEEKTTKVVSQKQIDELTEKSAELSGWLRKNFDPYTVIVITDTGVKILSTECACHFTRM